MTGVTTFLNQLSWPHGKAKQEPVCIDGHTRLNAATNVGIQEVPVWFHEFATEEEAIEKVIKLQSNRRNMTDAEILACVRVLDQRRRAGRPKKELAQGCANFSDNEAGQDEQENQDSCAVPSTGKSAQAIGEMLGISTRKVEQARTVIDHADPETLEAVNNLETSINKASQETQKKRKQAKAESATENSCEKATDEVAEPEQPAQVDVGDKEPTSAVGFFPDSLGRSVHVFLPDWQFDALIGLCDGYVDSHVRKAVDLYVESLGLQPPHEDIDDDEHYFDIEW